MPSPPGAPGRRRLLGLSVPVALGAMGRWVLVGGAVLLVVAVAVVVLVLLLGGGGEEEPVPVSDSPEDPAVELFAGWSTGMCAVRESGALICWGLGFAAEGHAFFPAGDFRSADVGGVGVCGVRPSGELACWDRDRDRDREDEDDQGFRFWVRTPTPPGTFRTVGVGEEQACALARSGELACWDGDGDEVRAPPGVYRWLSVGDESACAVRDLGEVACWDGDGSEVGAPAGKYRLVAVGYDRTCAIRESGELACWDGQGAEVEAPPGKYRSVSVSEYDGGSRLVCAVRESGGVACWTASVGSGRSPAAQDGPPGEYVSVTVGRSEDVCAIRASGGVVCWGDWVRRLADAPQGKYSSLSVGTHACAIRESGEIDCWGGTDHPWVDPWGRCDSFLCLPAGVLDAPPGVYRSVAVNAYNTCALSESGEIVCWPVNQSGLTDAPPGKHRLLETAGAYACAIRESGEIACWGDNSESTGAPAGAYRSLSVGAHACAIRESGEINCWGGNLFGETSAPPGKFRLLEQGSFYACAIRESGEVACWGNGFSFWRVLAAPDLSQPGQAMDPPPGKFRSLSLGSDAACGIRVSGEVSCWGRNDWGQTDAPPGKFRSVSVGVWNACGIRESGEIACWGGNDVHAVLR